ncbi:YitT family protein [Bacillus halotolerans]|uniref:YitT family protein n=1 Tax=Bacillus halotolerans TaxID=260554 RepID=A0A9Q4EHU8_9BACI|nr:YitT family protein [Bacillus halotolerans]MCY9183440.1 YitT family protein [Bacillus halotolerans]MCY9199538.1 YitT family protein [Bacillus halotolerans]MDG0764557.1 YitT family protein [Bacillus halotolerans]UUI84065.1 YitT family protein [Bacillus halotolerans]
MKRMFLILTACLITSAGVLTLRHSHVLTGGTAGLSLSLTYVFHSSFAIIFFLINIPFYVFSFIRMGASFTLSTLFAVTALTLFTSADHWLPPVSFSPFAGAICGGALIGFGLSLMFYHQASLGGANILALFMQKRYGWNPGTVNFAFDFAVVLAGIFSVGVQKGLCSILSIAITGLAVGFFKHKIKSSYSLKPDLLKNFTSGQSQEASS